MAKLTGDFHDYANALLKFLILLDTITALQPPVPTHYNHSPRHKEENDSHALKKIQYSFRNITSSITKRIADSLLLLLH
jgi:hypothetical protein